MTQGWRRGGAGGGRVPTGARGGGGVLRDATGQSEHSLADGAGEKAGGWGREQGEM